MIKLKDLIPTHNRIRYEKSIPHFVDWLRDGRIFRGFKRVITIAQFEDEALYLHDGHHRICAAHIVGVEQLLDCEYRIKSYKYEDYMQCKPEQGWFTPFDPRTHCRLPDFFDFKNRASDYWKQNHRTLDVADQFCEVRKIHSIAELVATIDEARSL